MLFLCTYDRDHSKWLLCETTDLEICPHCSYIQEENFNFKVLLSSNTYYPIKITNTAWRKMLSIFRMGGAGIITCRYVKPHPMFNADMWKFTPCSMRKCCKMWTTHTGNFGPRSRVGGRVTELIFSFLHSQYMAYGNGELFKTAFRSIRRVH